MRASRPRTTGCRGAVCVLAWASLKTVPLRSCAGRCSTRPRTRPTKVRAAARRPCPQLSATRILSRRVTSRRSGVVPERRLHRGNRCPGASVSPDWSMSLRRVPAGSRSSRFEASTWLRPDSPIPGFRFRDPCPPSSSPSLLFCMREDKAGALRPCWRTGPARSCDLSPASTLQFRIARLSINPRRLINAHARAARRQIKRTSRIWDTAATPCR